MNLDECFKRRLLRKDKPDPQRAHRSIEVAEAKLEQAQKAHAHELHDASLVLAYTAMFHSARALLFADGIIEKSHVCLVEYLRSEYSRKGVISEGLVNSLDRMRIDRHEAVYGLEVSVRSTQAANDLKESEQFIQAAKHLLIAKGKRTSQTIPPP